MVQQQPNLTPANMKALQLFAASLCFFLSPLISQAQVDYDLADFQSPRVDYKGLNLGTSLFSNFASRTDASDFSASGNINLSAFAYKNTDSYVGRQRLFFDASTSITSSEYSDLNFQENATSATQLYQLSGTSTNRFYLNRRSGTFLGLHGAMNQYLNFGSSEQNYLVNTSERKSSNIRSHSQVYLSIGSGRIEPVRNARLAYDAYNMIGLKNRLNAPPTDEHIDELAAVMTELINTRFFDNRFKYIFQLEQIDSTMRSTGLITEADMQYFAQLADVWSYANYFERGSGSLWEVGVVADRQYDMDRNRIWENDSLTSDTENLGNDYGSLMGFVTYRNEKPLNVKWQRDFALSLFSGADQYLSDLDDFRYNQVPLWRSAFSGYYEIGWYPNTRTFWTNAVEATTSYGYDPNEITGHDLGFSVTFYSRLYYWFTPRFRVGGTFSLGYNREQLPATFDPMLFGPEYETFRRSPYNSLSGDLSVQLSYALF